MANRTAVSADVSDVHAQYRGLSGPRERVVSIGLSAAMLLLFALAIWRMGYLVAQGPKLGENLVAVNIAAESSSSAAKKAVTQPKNPAVQPVVTPSVITPVPPPKISIPSANPVPAPMIKMSGSDFAASDISKLGSGSGKGNSSKSYGPGEGPQGQTLYRAEWYREPTHAELAGYLNQTSARADWAEIACRTAENFRVENCQSLGESPAGSGLARSLRQAAWQFQVRPPRVDGKPLIGAWVRIHFDFTHGPVKE